jgi:hypothetical protein
MATSLGVSFQLRDEFCMGSYEDRTWACEAEESPVLEAVAREQLVKIQQAGKRLNRCCGRPRVLNWIPQNTCGMN